MAIPSRRPAALEWFTRLTAACTLFLIFAGGMVTSTGSGLSVPDWPLSYGMLMPPMVGGIFYEHGHRMIASLVGLLTLIQAVWIWHLEPRRRVRLLAVATLAVVVTQGLLGGLTVILLLPPAVSVAHACLAQAYFCLVITLAMVTWNGWERGEPAAEARSCWRLPAAVAGAVYLQLILGATMRHLGAGLAIPDFPWHQGHWLPAFTSLEVTVHFAHRAGGYLVGTLVLLASSRLVRDPALPLGSRILAASTALVVLTQITLGAFTVLWEKPPVLTSLHVANGALLLGLEVILALQLYRRRRAD